MHDSMSYDPIQGKDLGHLTSTVRHLIFNNQVRGVVSVPYRANLYYYCIIFIVPCYLSSSNLA